MSKIEPMPEDTRRALLEALAELVRLERPGTVVEIIDRRASGSAPPDPSPSRDPV